MRERGFTLVESLVAAAIFSLILLGALKFYVTNRDLYNRGQSLAEVHQNARVGLESMAREIRCAGFDPGNTVPSLSPVASIRVAESNRLTFVADIDNNGTLNQVTYRLLGSRILRETSTWNGTSFPAASGGEVSDEVSTLTFTYFDGESPNNAIAAPVASADLADIRKVTVAIVSDRTTIGMQASYPLTVDVELRN